MCIHEIGYYRNTLFLIIYFYKDVSFSYLSNIKYPDVKINGTFHIVGEENLPPKMAV